MKGLILAAGRGSRMGEATDEQPKCLTILGEHSLLDWQRKAMAEAGLDDIAIVTGYRAEKLEAIHSPTILNARWSQTNMVMSLMCAKPWCLEGENDATVISYSDIVYHPDIVSALKSAPGHLVITYDTAWHDLWSQRFQNPLDDAETFKLDSAGRLVEIGKKPSGLSEIQGQYMGLLKFSTEAWSAVEQVLMGLTPFQQDALDMTGLLNRLLENGFPVNTVSISGRWCEIDSQDDWKHAQSLLKENKSWTHDWRFLYSCA